MSLRIECPACLEVAEAKLIRCTERAAVFACYECETEFSTHVARSADDDVDDDSGSEGLRCPKCEGAVNESATNCPGCGLQAERFETFEQDGLAATNELLAAWKRVDEAWENEALHEAFAVEVERCGDYLHGARWYRQEASQNERAIRAQAMLDRIQSMASATLLSSNPKRENSRRKTLILLVLFIMICLAGVGIILMLKNAAKYQQRGASLSSIAGQA